MTLDEWMRAHPARKTVEFGRQVGASHSAVSRWRSGKLRPSWPQLAAILRATGGQVTPNDFVQPAEWPAHGEARAVRLHQAPDGPGPGAGS